MHCHNCTCLWGQVAAGQWGGKCHQIWVHLWNCGSIRVPGMFPFLRILSFAGSHCLCLSKLLLPQHHSVAWELGSERDERKRKNPGGFRTLVDCYAFAFPFLEPELKGFSRVFPVCIDLSPFGLLCKNTIDYVTNKQQKPFCHVSRGWEIQDQDVGTFGIQWGSTSLFIARCFYSVLSWWKGWGC